MDINWMGIFLIFFLILINAIFAASEIAVLTSSRVKIQQLSERDNKSAIELLKLMDDPSRFLSTIQIGITLSGFLASATAAVGVAFLFEELFVRLGISGSMANALAVISVTLLISYITLVFGELAPKRLALQWSEEIALFLARPIRWIELFAFPAVRFLTFSTNVIVRTLGGNVNQSEKEISEEEIRIYISEHQSLPEEEKRMIEAVFDFGDQFVRQVMVPRTEIEYLDAEKTIGEALHNVCSKGFPSFPVYQENKENIIGVVRMQDIACQILSNPEMKIKEVARPVLFVPETRKTVAMLKDFRKEDLEMAIIIDEYGGVSGLVTLKDLIDEIIGDVDDEDVFNRTSEGHWIIEGDEIIDDVADALNLDRELFNESYETLAGFILEHLGHIPLEGEFLSWEGYDFKILEMENRKINKVLVSLSQQSNT